MRPDEINFDECERLYKRFPPSKEVRTWVAEFWDPQRGDVIFSKDADTFAEALDGVRTLLVKGKYKGSELHICLRWNGLPCTGAEDADRSSEPT